MSTRENDLPRCTGRTELIAGSTLVILALLTAIFAPVLTLQDPTNQLLEGA